jgi:flagellar biosynthesis/type III secretory pathway M-ring protein FliF/YscJ
LSAIASRHKQKLSDIITAALIIIIIIILVALYCIVVSASALSAPTTMTKTAGSTDIHQRVRRNNTEKEKAHKKKERENKKRKEEREEREKNRAKNYSKPRAKRKCRRCKTKGGKYATTCNVQRWRMAGGVAACEYYSATGGGSG